MSTREQRERVVREHVDAEARGDWAAALRTFGKPKYEIMATQIGIARDPTSIAGRVATAINHPIVVGSAFVRGMFAR